MAIATGVKSDGAIAAILALAQMSASRTVRQRAMERCTSFCLTPIAYGARNCEKCITYLAGSSLVVMPLSEHLLKQLL
jgi:hypothetical protein